VALALAAVVGGRADAATDYRNAVQATFVQVSSALPGDTAAAQVALGTLEAGTGHTQPEIIADLEAHPPDFVDAQRRLRALLDALDSPATTGDPALAQQKLHDVLSMKRYDALHQPPSLVDRITQWISDRIRDFLRLLFGPRGVGSVVPDWLFYLIGVAIIGAVAIVVFLSARGRFSATAEAGRTHGPQAPADYFEAADRMARAGDRVGAIRALCAGVAATLAGERTWEGSPLTVREIFQRAPDPGRLRPLLGPFEAAVYGGRDVDPETYARAEAAAAPFRARKEAAAA